MDQVVYWIEAEGTGHWFFYIFPVVLLILFFILHGRRIVFLAPCLLMMAVIVNPVFYQIWDGFGLYAYWRILWAVPVIPVIASFVPGITERIGGRAGADPSRYTDSKMWFKMPVVAVGIALVVFGGTFISKGPRGSFEKASNSEKVPGYVAEIADRLLELDDTPRAVFQNPIGQYTRQYSGRIEQLYGRDIEGYILRASADARSVHTELANIKSDLKTVATVMADNDYEYLVLDPRGREGQLTEAEFEEIDQVAGYGIFKAHGKPSVIREKNELGQIVRTTTVNADGLPVNGPNGCAIVEWQYNSNGEIVREFRTDADGNGAADSNGMSGYEREYDNRSHIVMERMLGADGTAKANSIGYAEMRREYQGSNIVKESYYDTEGHLVNRTDTKYAAVVTTYDRAGNRTGEKYYDADGNMVCSSAGYAEIKRVYQQKRLTEEWYYDESGQLIPIALGYAGRKMSYDNAGNMITESYYDAAGNLTDNINGYFVEERKYDDNRNIIFQKFLDAEGNPVITGSGYAEVHRVYEGTHLIREEYFGPDGCSFCKLAGYTAILQTWDEDTLVSREYLDSFGKPVNRTDGYAKVVWENNGKCSNARFYASDGTKIPVEGLNLATDVKSDEDGWSNWLIPSYNVSNSCQNIGYVNLGQKADGDVYTCTVEIEFREVSATAGNMLRFRTQGAQDGKWFAGNVWNGNLIYLSDAPADGVYTYTSTFPVTGDMVDISSFNIGFRCDYWAAGMYRVRLVKVEKGNESTAWSPGL